MQYRDVGPHRLEGFRDQLRRWAIGASGARWRTGSRWRRCTGPWTSA